MQQLGEAYLRAPERYPSAKVLAHEERFPKRISSYAVISNVKAIS